MQARVSLLLAHPVMYILKTQQCIVHFENNQQALLATYDKLHYWDLWKCVGAMQLELPYVQRICRFPASQNYK